ncbi:MAG: Type II secretion system F domain protein [Parcubacteria group bacterium GW2011_GWD2_38_12]|nr:MAG: Type II secretion system F domain protein [Parcubacteria group bacterium GW2011_GWC2_36_17]KKQ51120.1 MAG: Type II secretion system F domain protein [Parcubacteria group bacterium GW2011_GWD2_38_12]
MKFSYQAKTKQGELQSGVVEAFSREAAIDVLQRHGLIILKLNTESEAPTLTRRIRIFESIKKKEVVIFSRQLSTLFSAKVPLVESLQILSSQAISPIFQEIVMDIARELEGGMALSLAMSKYPKVFSKFYVSMVKSGEVSGKLEEVFNYLAESLERQNNLSAKVLNSLIYPAFILTVFVGVIILMFVYVIPKLKIMVEETGQSFPLPTRIIFGVSDFIIVYGPYILPLILIGGFFAGRYFLNTQSGRLIFDKFKLKIPIFGELFQKISISRFAESLGTLISGGLPIVQAIEVTSDIVGNEYYKNIFMQTAQQVRKGFPISSVLKLYPDIIPPMVAQMVFVGEETGRLEEIFKKTANFYEQETSRMLDAMVSLIEPMMIIMLGGMVFILVAAILMPIYNIAQGI